VQERIPCHVALLTAAAQHAAPIPEDGSIHLAQAKRIAGHANVGVVPLEALVNPTRLVLDTLVKNLAHQALQVLERPLEPGLLGFPSDRKGTVPVPRTVMRKPQEIEGLRLSAALVLGLAVRPWPKGNQAGLRRFQFQTELVEPLAQHGLKPFGVPLMLKAHDKASRPGDLHPESLPEPDVNLSAHPAPLPRRRPYPLPVCKQVWFALGYPAQPVFRPAGVVFQLLVLPCRPSDQGPIDMP